MGVLGGFGWFESGAMGGWILVLDQIFMGIQGIELVREKITIVASKPFIYFKCQSRKTVITYGDTAGKAGGTTASASTTVHSSNFIASDCTFAVC